MFIFIAFTGATYLFYKYPEIKRHYITGIFLVYLMLYVGALTYLMGFDNAVKKENDAAYAILRETRKGATLESANQSIQAVLKRLDENQNEVAFVKKCVEVYGLIIYVILGVLVFATNEYNKSRGPNNAKLKNKTK